MKIRPRRTVAAAAVSFAVLALAGCGGSSDDEPASAPTGGTASDTTSSAAPEEGSETAVSGDASDLADMIRKTYTDGRSAHVTMDMGDQGSGEGDIVFDGDAAALDLTMSLGGTDAQMRLVDATMYMKQASLGEKWIKVSSADLGVAGSIDPSEALKNLEQYAGNATEVEDGHYQLTESGTTTDLYFGDDGYISKVVVAGTGAGDITMTYSDWGKDIEIKAPDAGDVTEMPGLPGAS